MQEIQFDYYRGMEAEQYTFYRIPKILFTAECFKSLSCEAKVLYGLLLDRMSLSIKNRWFDEEDRVYIIFTVEEIADLMNCGTQKAVRLLKELDAENGIGLVEKKRLGLGKPNVIYVKNFIIRQTDKSENHVEMPENPQNCENHNSGMMKTTIQEYPESQFKNDENHNSGMMETTIQEYPKSQSSNTDINNTEFSKKEGINTKLNRMGFTVSNPIYTNQTLPISSNPDIIPDVMKKMEAFRNIIREHIAYGYFQDERYYRMKDINELIELIVEVMMMPDDGTLRIAGVEKPVAVVKSRFMELNQTHIEYILLCLNTNTTKVGNIKAYLLTTLYNAPMTISNYYTAEVNYNLYGKNHEK